jgi:hypothetical protein
MFAKPTPRTYATVTMYTGMVATLAGNALAADWADPVAVVISAFPALALFVVFEMVIRSKANPSRRRWYHVAMRLIPAVGIMGIAAWTSFGHLVAVAQAHGQHGANAYLIALLPDAMMILATVVLKDSPQTRTGARKAAAVAAPAPAPAKVAKPRKPRAPRTPSTKVTQAPANVPVRAAIVPALIPAPPVPNRTKVLLAGS